MNPDQIFYIEMAKVLAPIISSALGAYFVYKAVGKKVDNVKESVGNKVDDLHHEINSKMTQLIVAEKQVSKQEGIEEVKSDLGSTLIIEGKG